MSRMIVLLVTLGALSACGGDVETHGGGGSCPTCSTAPSIINNANACAERRVLASGPTKGGGGGGGTPTTTTTTTTTGTPFAAPPVTNVTVNTPPSTSVSNSCGGAAPAP